MIQILKKIFWFPFSSHSKIEKFQTRIRDYEWNEIKKNIKVNSRFLDLGCGAGYFLEKAEKELNCDVFGIDPKPGEHGVGRFNELKINNKIIQGFAENIPFESNYFDVILCSHVLEHVDDENQSLNEILRVLKDDGVLIIGMPTASMSIIALISHYIFTTHVNILFFIKDLFTKNSLQRFIHIIIPGSHSLPNHKYIIYDLYKYRINNWRKIVASKFKINEEILPGLYPYPDYVQFFKPIKLNKFSSSIFFVCTKK
jgi:ubiquinone/menaquinone biosynthesis C-methylase UbiE